MLQKISLLIEAKENYKITKNANYLSTCASFACSENIGIKKIAFDILKYINFPEHLLYFEDKYKKNGGGFGTVAKKYFTEWYKNACPLLLIKETKHNIKKHSQILKKLHINFGEYDEEKQTVFYYITTQNKEKTVNFSKKFKDVEYILNQINCVDGFIVI